MNRGEVWWAEHPDTGKRPFFVLTREAAIPVAVIVYGLILWSIIRYRRTRGDPDRMPKQFRYHIPLEILYTAIRALPHVQELHRREELKRALCELLLREHGVQPVAQGTAGERRLWKTSDRPVTPALSGQFGTEWLTRVNHSVRN